jgi:hypothetical protein
LFAGDFQTPAEQEPSLSKPQPPFHDLRLSHNGTFWPEGAAPERRAFLMPLANPYEFLAFGIIGKPQQVCFVALGMVMEHLGAFITRMDRDDAKVELYTRAPVPGWLLKQYAGAPPFEGHEYEEPPPPPVTGLLPDRIDTAPSTPLWTEGDSFTRRALLLPVKDPSEFLAIGVLSQLEKVLFVRVGSVRDDLGAFIERMVRDEARVELHARLPFPEPRLRSFISSRSERGAR